MGQKINGFFLVKGSKKMETVYCDFYSNGNGTACLRFLVIACLILFLCSVAEMDRIRRRQIGARPFLRPKKFEFWNTKHSDSVRVDEGERRTRHGFIIREIHGTAPGNLFLFIHGVGAISSFIILLCCFRSYSLFEWESNRDGFGRRDKHHR